MVEILKQGVNKPLVIEKQVTIIFAGVNGFLDDVDPKDVVRFENEFHQFIEQKYSNILSGLEAKKTIDNEIKEQLTTAIKEFKIIFNAK
jgi:F-type H+/Na+-transporting ATPase subunit alpha